MSTDCRVEFDWLPEREAVMSLWAETLWTLQQHGVLPPVMYRTANSKKAALKQPVDLCDMAAVQGFVAKALNEKAWAEGIAVDDLWHEQDGGAVIRFSIWGSRQKNKFVLDSQWDSKKALEEALAQVAAKCRVSFNIVWF